MAGMINFVAVNLDALFIPAIIAAGFAMKALTVAVMANPFGLILTGITAAAMGIYIFRNAIADTFNKVIQKDIPTMILNFKIFGEKVKLAFEEKLMMPVKQTFNNFINFIIGKVNDGVNEINRYLDLVPQFIKDKFGAEKLPTIDLIPDPASNSADIQSKIDAYIQEIAKISGKVIKKADLPSIKEMLFGKTEDVEGDASTGFGQLSAFEQFLNSAEAGYKKFQTGIKSTQDEIQGIFKKSYDGLTNLTMDFLEKGKASFKDFATSIVRELIRIAIQKLVIDKMFASFSGLFGGSKKTTELPKINMPTTLPKFEGGGFTGMGSRSGGVDGKGGFPAILHPNETVVDHTKGQGMGATVNFNISTVDAAGFDQLLTSRKGLITQIINNAMNTQGKMGIV